MTLVKELSKYVIRFSESTGGQMEEICQQTSRRIYELDSYS
jgi:hypothetical protein